MSGIVEDHHRACDGFTEVVRAAVGRWESPSPCAGWDARGVLEHVIGFHDVLLLRPLGVSPAKPEDDPLRRWTLTADALDGALAGPTVVEEKGSLIAVLTTDVVVHTWDLAKAVGAAVTLDPRLAQIGLDRALANREQFERSEMFGPPVAVPDDAGVVDRLLGQFGRDPGWTPPPVGRTRPPG